MECAVCIEPMNTLKFVQMASESEDAIDSQDSSCVRLKCGHAFHICCSIGSFRSGLACPSCRESVPAQEFEIFVLDDSVESDDTVTENIDNVRCIQRVRDIAVRNARRKLNLSTKSYNILCEKLRSDRKKITSKALKDFKLSRYSEYRNALKEVQKSLKIVKKCEKDSLLKFGLSEEDVKTYINQSRGFDYNSEEYVKCKDENALDPLNKMFWR
jgi:hypothetical protein